MGGFSPYLKESMIDIDIYTNAHTLANSLHDVSCANNNRFAVVVCFRLEFMPRKCEFFWKFSSLQILKKFVPL